MPAELLGGVEGDEPAHGYILEQDREIAEKSGRLSVAIKSISRVGAKKRNKLPSRQPVEIGLKAKK